MRRLFSLQIKRTVEGTALDLPRIHRHITPMSILKIARMGHPVLGRVAEPVVNIKAPEIQRLIEDMIETMHEASGQGLAAPQVYQSLQLVVYLPPEDEEGERPPTVLVNPEITPTSEEMIPGWEGCLSVPGLRGIVPRHKSIHLKAQNAEGEVIDMELTGHHARVVQHECDHLDGILYTRRMTDMASLVFESEMPHIVAAYEADEEAKEEA